MINTQLVKDALGWELVLWLSGYLLGIVFFVALPPSLIGWAVLPIGVLLTCWVLLKQVKGENFRRYLIMAVVTLMTGCLAQPLDSIPDSLLGVWHGDTTVRLPIVFVPEPDSDPTDDVVLPVALNLTIHDDGTVTGTVGDAQLVNCVLKQNRGELGRQLNLATDYIIMDGYLSGPIVPEDEESEKAFTLPFNIVDDRMVGTLFWVMEWKYPLPLMPHVELVKEQ